MDWITAVRNAKKTSIIQDGMYKLILLLIHLVLFVKFVLSNKSEYYKNDIYKK